MKDFSHSEKVAKECLIAAISPLEHGIEILGGTPQNVQVYIFPTRKTIKGVDKDGKSSCGLYQ